jgi:hypothetical protein
MLVSTLSLALALANMNAGQDYILQSYWPLGASGAILITSRKYYNFCKDTQRRGDTVKPFDPKQSWDLLLQLLGDDWKKLDREGRIPQSEITAAKQMLGRLGGLALGIQQAAILIKNDEIGGPTIVKTYEMFEKTYQTLPRRLLGERGSTERGLDTLWDMTFNSLAKNARVLLGVLAWLSPGKINIQARSVLLTRPQMPSPYICSYRRTKESWTADFNSAKKIPKT